jgi:hypothetical protein
MHEEIRRIRRELRVVKIYAVVMTAVLSILALGAFRQSTEKKPHFEEIDVERLNIVEKDGTPRLILSNKARYPGLILHGKEYPHPRGQAGILFFNNDGTEAGGLGTDVTHGPDGTVANSGIMFDQFDQDQTLGLSYQQRNGKREAGLYVWDRPDVPIVQMLDSMQHVRAMPAGPAKDRAMAAMRTLAGRPRVMVGKTADSAATVVLADPRGKPRLRLTVDANGSPHLDFLDENGRVTYSLRDTTAAGGR